MTLKLCQTQRCSFLGSLFDYLMDLRSFCNNPQNNNGAFVCFCVNTQFYSERSPPSFF